jgi:DNA-binding transcriptional ArsR family regulator
MIQDLHHAEFVRHALTTGEHGVAAALTALAPGSRLRENVWELAGFGSELIELHGRGMLLLPTFHGTGPPLISCLPGNPLVLTYAAGPGIPLPRHHARRTGQALSDVIGPTRLAVLLLLGDEHSTSELARRLKLSNATASSQTSALRRAGLISSTRAGRAVLHLRTLWAACWCHATPDCARCPANPIRANVSFWPYLPRGNGCPSTRSRRRSARV